MRKLRIYFYMADRGDLPPLTITVADDFELEDVGGDFIYVEAEDGAHHWINSGRVLRVELDPEP